MSNVSVTEEARAQLIEEQLQARRTSDGNHETYRLSVRDENQLLPVIILPVNSVLLNPNSHRIQAELESHPQKDLIDNAPYSVEAQAVLEGLLRNTDYFDDLRDDLKESGQREPGVITRKGILVNANRRTVALRDIEAEFVRVAALPPGLLEKDLDGIELDLQMRRDYFAQYTFTNRLKFIEAWRTKYGLTDRKLARRLGFAASSEEREIEKGAKQVQLEARLLTMIRDVQEMSNNTLPLTFFNNSRQTLIDVDQAYEKLKKRDPKAATALRDTQLLTLFLGGSRYRMVRKMEEGFFTQYLIPALENSSVLSEILGTLTRGQDTSEEEDLGLSVLGTEDGLNHDEGDPKYLLQLLSTTAGDDVITLKGDDGVEREFAREGLIEELEVAIEEALEDLSVDNSREDRLTTPINRARDAERKLKKAHQAWRKVKTNPSFDSQRFEFHVGKAERLARKLHEEVQQVNEKAKADLKGLGS